ncbi:MAG: hypothetical protein WBS33_00730 [Verrucomicrobiia bacterium]
MHNDEYSNAGSRFNASGTVLHRRLPIVARHRRGGSDLCVDHQSVLQNCPGRTWPADSPEFQRLDVESGNILFCSELCLDIYRVREFVPTGKSGRTQKRREHSTTACGFAKEKIRKTITQARYETSAKGCLSC